MKLSSKINNELRLVAHPQIFHCGDETSSHSLIKNTTQSSTLDS